MGQPMDVPPSTSGGGHDHPHEHPHTHDDIRAEVIAVRDGYSTDLAAMEERHQADMRQLRTEVLADAMVRDAQGKAEDAADDAADAAAKAAEAAGDDEDVADELDDVDGEDESMAPPPAPIAHTPPAHREKPRGFWDMYG